MSQILQVALDRCVHETVDGETVVIDTTTGVLTLLVGTGPVIWDRLVCGARTDELLADVGDRYGAGAVSGVESFVHALQGAGLVVEVETATPSPTALAWPAHFELPTFERYDDIAEVIGMDPIHEVDPSQGWPRGQSTAP